jgi:hypothetical protein
MNGCAERKDIKLSRNYAWRISSHPPDNKDEEKVQGEVGAILKNQKIRFLHTATIT